jgi:hypothetical protein
MRWIRAGVERRCCCGYWRCKEEQVHDEYLSTVRFGPRESMARKTAGTAFVEGLVEHPDFGDGRQDCFQDIGCIVEPGQERNA